MHIECDGNTLMKIKPLVRFTIRVLMARIVSNYLREGFVLVIGVSLDLGLRRAQLCYAGDALLNTVRSPPVNALSFIVRKRAQPHGTW